MSSNPAVTVQAKPQVHDRAAKRDFVILGGVLVLFVIGLIGVIAATGWEETWAQVSKLGPVQISILLALSILNYVARASRWHLFGHKLGLSIPHHLSFLHFFGGFAMSITPGRIGELIRLRWMRKVSGWRVERLAPLPIVDRAFDLAGLGLLLVIGLAMSQTGTSGAMIVACLALASAFIVTRPAVLRTLIEVVWRLIGRRPKVFIRLRRAASHMQVFSNTPTSLSGMALTLVAWLAECYALYLLLLWMDAPLDLATVTVIFIFATLAGGLTGAPGGIGGAEAAMVVLLGMNGIPLEVAVPATAMIRLTTLWFAILLGLLFFPLAESSARRPAL